MGKIEGSQGRGPGAASFEYDFATHGGAVGAITLTALSGVLPDNAVITRCIQESITDLTSGGAATVKLGITGNDDAFLAATAYSDASFDVDIVTSRAAELPLKVNAAAGVNALATIATAALTAGRFKLHVEWEPGA